uniref:2-aminoethanethiol dioxygenase n=1 Tax=Denticeps clupeoides TaxID=299321 RepID=A0AAY4ABU6_9TELE
MPRDAKPPLIQKIADQAHTTFASADGKARPDAQAELVRLAGEIRASDLRIAAPKTKSSKPSRHSPPVTYMHICQTDAFSMGVFLLRRGASIPLHDHPGMDGILKVLYGKVNIRSFDKLDRPADGECDGLFDPPLAPGAHKDALWRSTLRSTGEFSEESGPCVLTPLQDNLHQIRAVGGPAAFLDILAPPYDPGDGRDCHYFRVLEAAARSDEAQAWLLEVPQPESFSCGAEPYPGPEVSNKDILS